MLNIYCAGKINPRDWRHELFPGLASARLRKASNTDGATWVLDSPPPRRGREIVYAGPYFMARCEGPHGLDNPAALKHYDTIYDFNRVDMCLEWIDAADAVFAWIDDLTAFGTLVELGYAVAKKKMVATYMPDDATLARELWFAHFAAGGAEAPDPIAAFEDFEAEAVRLFYRTRLRTMPYPQYLQTDHWRQLRVRKLAEAGHRCQLCNATQSLAVHHRTYERRGEELLSDLTVLCRPCHSKFHGRTPFLTSKGLE